MSRAVFGVAPLLGACLVLAVGLCPGVLSAQEEDSTTRTWSDVTGKFKVTASFVSLKDDVVTLRQENGEELEIPLDKLGLVDRGFARRFATAASENPFKPKSDSPFKPKMSKDDAGSSGDEPAVDESADEPVVPARTVKVNWNSANAADPQPQADQWAGAVTAEQLSEGTATLPSKTIRLPERRDFFEKLQGFAFSPSGEKAAVGYTLNKPGSKETSTRIVLIDTTAGKGLGAAVIDGEYVPLGLENDGRRMLVRKAEFGFGNNDELEVWSLSKAGLQRNLKWTPHDDIQGAQRDIHWGTIVADGRGLTVGAGGRLALWDLESGKPLWYLDLNGAQKPALSANGKYLAYQADKAVGVLEVESGTVLALLPTEDLRLGHLAFSPDGKSLAGSSHETLWVWDVATGSLASEVNIRNFSGFGNLIWTDPEHVLVGDQYLIHVPSRIPVWQYTGGSNVRSIGGVTWFCIAPHDQGEALVGSELPHAAAAEALQQAMDDPEFFLLRPGSTVSIDVSGIPQPDRSNVTAMLTKSLGEAGFKIAAGAPVSVQASMKRGKTREITYRTFGSFNNSTHSVQEYNLKLAFVTGGKSAWETSTVHVAAPFMVNLKKGETIDSVLKKSDKPGYRFFENLRLPKFVPRPSERPVLGTTAVSLQGVR